MRVGIRERFKIQGSACEDWTTVYCCYPPRRLSNDPGDEEEDEEPDLPGVHYAGELLREKDRRRYDDENGPLSPSGLITQARNEAPCGPTHPAWHSGRGRAARGDWGACEKEIYPSCVSSESKVEVLQSEPIDLGVGGAGVRQRRSPGAELTLTESPNCVGMADAADDRTVAAGLPSSATLSKGAAATQGPSVHVTEGHGAVYLTAGTMQLASTVYCSCYEEQAPLAVSSPRKCSYAPTISSCRSARSA
ncbi:hypothetical protein SKAU_G00266000 [Synaphobranchus kaupii]|uniref:Uncharacterized protein n=1 Tax=Synaphobranchus kaupii TaxID=118154 RepID=A0A9Q1EZM9_SYNKA|nr:hypothetical protein SKAU_G00266000 [Synaphobranchus kaupii]